MRSFESVDPTPRLAKDILAVSAVFALCLAARYAAWRAGLSADPDVLIHHWQHLPLDRLATDLAGSLADLRSQPPLWNLLIGFGAKICAADVICTTGFLHTLNVVLTGVLLVTLYSAARILGAGITPSLAASAFAGLSPSTFFYETYVFYPHLTAVLVSVSVLGTAILAVRRSLAGYALLLAGVSGLALTITLWHPLMVVLVAALALPIVRSRRMAAVVLAVPMVAVAGLPAAKNLADTGHFASGTWMGLNLAQTAPGLTNEERAFCSFTRLLAEGGLGTGPTEGDILNRPLVADVSRECTGLALAAIRAEPWDWAGAIASRLVQSHILRAYHSTFAPPGFDKIPGIATPDRLVKPDRHIDVPSIVLLALGFLSFPVILATSAWVAATRRREPGGAFAGILLVIIVWHTAVSHAANGAEQNRMRYTIEPAYLGLAVMLISRWRRRSSAQASEGVNPAPEILRLSPAGRLVQSEA